MKSNPQRETALRLLAATGMRRSHYEPPLVRLLWRLEIDVPPPHFAPFAGSALLAGGLFALAWGLLTWFFVWPGLSATASLVACVVAGALFGIGLAGYYAHGRQRFRLPSWRSLQPSKAGV